MLSRTLQFKNLANKILPFCLVLFEGHCDNYKKKRKLATKGKPAAAATTNAGSAAGVLFHLDVDCLRPE